MAVGNIANNGLTPANSKTLEFVNHGNSIHPGDTVYIDKGRLYKHLNCGAGSTRYSGSAGLVVSRLQQYTDHRYGRWYQCYWVPGLYGSRYRFVLGVSSLALVGQAEMALYVVETVRNFRFVTFTDCVIKSKEWSHAINLGRRYKIQI